MPRRCTICTSTEREAINHDIFAAELTYQKIADKYGVGISAIKRHRKNHLMPLIRQAQEEQQKEAVAQYATVTEYLDAMINENFDSVRKTATIKDLIRLLELKAKIMGHDTAEISVKFRWGAGLDTTLETTIQQKKRAQLEEFDEQEFYDDITDLEEEAVVLERNK